MLDDYYAVIDIKSATIYFFKDREFVLFPAKSIFSGYDMNKMKFYFPVLMLFLLLYSCKKSDRILSIKEDVLFKLDYGNFENQLNLFSITNSRNIRTSFTMRDGFFYIVNGEAEKLMSLNSYGDLLSIHYNEDYYENFNSGLPSVSSSVWKAVSYPFSFSGKVAADSRKYIYAVCTVPKERNEQDEVENLVYSQVILRFSSNGTVIDYIGQQGPGGTPFPFISRIFATQNNELVAVCKINEGLCAYWFAENGFLRFKIPITSKNIPMLAKEGFNSLQDMYITVESIVPDCYADRIYIKADYYVPYIDEESKVQSGIDFVESVVYPLNIETGSYGEALIIPPYEEALAEEFGKLNHKIPYEFLGVTKNSWFFFIITTEYGFNIEMIQPGTQYILKRHFYAEHSEILYNSFSLSDEGIISAMISNKDFSNIVWWRTDSLIDAILKS